MSATTAETKVLPTVDPDAPSYPIWMVYVVAFIFAFAAGMILMGIIVGAR